MSQQEQEIHRRKIEEMLAQLKDGQSLVVARCVGNGPDELVQLIVVGSQATKGSIRSAIQAGSIVLREADDDGNIHSIDLHGPDYEQFPFGPGLYLASAAKQAGSTCTLRRLTFDTGQKALSPPGPTIIDK